MSFHHSVEANAVRISMDCNGKSLQDLNHNNKGDSQSMIWPLNEGFGESHSNNGDSFVPVKHSVDGVSVIEKVNDFIEMSKAIRFAMRGCENFYMIFLIGWN